jgi:hypothetical protein
MNLKEDPKISGSKSGSNMNTIQTVVSPINTLYSTMKVMMFGNSTTIDPNIAINPIISNSPLQPSPSVSQEIIPPQTPRGYRQIPSIENNQQIHTNKSKQSLKSQKKKSNLKTWKKPKGFLYWHKRILLWASTKKTALGYNAKWNYKSLTDVHDASLGSRVVFDIGTFKPFPKTLSRLYKTYTSSYIPSKNLTSSKKAMKDIGVLEPMTLNSINDFISHKSAIHTLTQNQRDILENALLLDEVDAGTSSTKQ